MNHLEFKVEAERIVLENEFGNIVAEVNFSKSDENTVNITRVFVDESLRGQGVAGKIVQATYDELKLRGVKVTPVCSYAVAWFERNKDKQDILK